MIGLVKSRPSSVRYYPDRSNESAGGRKGKLGLRIGLFRDNMDMTDQ